MSSARDRNTRSSYGLHVARAHYSNTGGSSQWEVNLNFWRLRLDRKFGVVMEGHRSGMRSTQRSTLEVSVSQRPKRYSPTAPTHAVGRQPLGLQLDRDRSNDRKYPLKLRSTRRARTTRPRAPSASGRITSGGCASIASLAL